MKKTGLVMIALLAVATAVQAFTEVQKKTDYIRKFDLDSDGKLSLEEYTEMTRMHLEGKENAAMYKEVAVKRFKAVDKNKDGFATPDEIVRQLVKVGYVPADADTGLPEDKINEILKFDKNADGKLSLEEYTEMTRMRLKDTEDAAKYKEVAKKQFKEIDKNKDGFASSEEIVLQLVKDGHISPEAAKGLANSVPASTKH